jgi:hypothetical protein
VSMEDSLDRLQQLVLDDVLELLCFAGDQGLPVEVGRKVFGDRKVDVVGKEVFVREDEA